MKIPCSVHADYDISCDMCIEENKCPPCSCENPNKPVYGVGCMKHPAEDNPLLQEARQAKFAN